MIIGVYRFLSNVNKSSANVHIITLSTNFTFLLALPPSHTQLMGLFYTLTLFYRKICTTDTQLARD